MARGMRRHVLLHTALLGAYHTRTETPPGSFAAHLQIITIIYLFSHVSDSQWVSTAGKNDFLGREMFDSFLHSRLTSHRKLKSLRIRERSDFIRRCKRKIDDIKFFVRELTSVIELGSLTRGKAVLEDEKDCKMTWTN